MSASGSRRSSHHIQPAGRQPREAIQPRLKTHFPMNESSAQPYPTMPMTIPMGAQSYPSSPPQGVYPQDSTWPDPSSSQTRSSYQFASPNYGDSSSSNNAYQTSPSSFGSSFSNPLLQSHTSYQPPSRPTLQEDLGAGHRDGLSPVQPTWHGWVKCSIDAVKLIEACLQHRLQRIQRRPDENERPRIISNGATFIFDESTTGILRWTDDKNWSPSRVRGNFMLYRELDATVPPGEKKKALKRTSPSSDAPAPHRSAGDRSRREDEASVWGSHTDSYKYAQGGLFKKTFSCYQGDTKWSVINYYDPRAVDAGLIAEVETDPNLQDIVPRPELVERLGRRDRPPTPSQTVSGQFARVYGQNPMNLGENNHMTEGYHPSGASTPNSFTSSYGPSHNGSASAFPQPNTSPITSGGGYYGQTYASNPQSSYAPNHPGLYAQPRFSQDPSLVNSHFSQAHNNGHFAQQSSPHPHMNYPQQAGGLQLAPMLHSHPPSGPLQDGYPANYPDHRSMHGHHDPDKRMMYSSSQHPPHAPFPN